MTNCTHFIADGVWDSTPLEAALLAEADRLVGGKNAFLVIDDIRGENNNRPK